MTANDAFYYEAAKIISTVQKGTGRIKSLCYASKHRNKPGLLALVTMAYSRNKKAWFIIKLLIYL